MHLASDYIRRNFSNAHSIPNPTNQPFNIDRLHLGNLQQRGLRNNGLVCSLISTILVFNTIGLKEKFVDPAQLILNGRPNVPLLILLKILRSLPSRQEFSLRSFISAWNRDGLQPRIGPNMDVHELLDGLLANIQLRQVPNQPPVLTKYECRYLCQNCNHTEDLQQWQGKVFGDIPNINVPAGANPVQITQLLGQFLQTRFPLNCGNCGVVVNGQYVVTKGQFTVIGLNRVPLNPAQGKVSTRVAQEPDSVQRGDLTERLLSVINHIGGLNGGHWISFHRVTTNQWYKNDDSRNITQSNHPFLTNLTIEESVNVVVYHNKHF